MKNIPAEARHWHGAAKDSWMQHLTYMTKVEKGASNEWLEPVTDAEYDKLPASGALLSVTDADYISRFDAFAYGEVVEQVKTRLDDRTRYILLPCCPRRVRATAEGTYCRQLPRGQRQGHAHCRHLIQSSLHRISPYA